MQSKLTTIPKDWRRIRLGDVFDISNGLWKGKSKNLMLCKVLRNTNFNNAGYLDVDDVSVIKADRKALNSRELSYGDILLEKSGGSDKQPVGRVVFFNLKENGYSFSNFTSCLRVKDKTFSSKFYFYYLYYFWLIGKTEQLQKRTTGIRNLDFESYKDMKVLVPSLLEQKKIAKILSTVDEEIEKTDEIIEKTEKLKKGLMQDLLTKGIGHKKFKKTKLGMVPEEWEVKTMRDICEVRQGLQIAIKDRFKKLARNRYVYITIKYLRDLEDAEFIENPSKKLICNKDDILMTRTGNTGVVVTGVKGVFHNNFFLVDYNRNEVDKDYLIDYLKSERIQKIILDRAGNTTIPDLNHGDFYSIPFVMPKKEEQKQIAEILSNIDSKILINKQIKEKLTRLKNGLMQDLLSGRVRVK